jgi:hypothetical protein
MLVARQKINENIAEYVLYMFQIEDLIRAYDFDLEAIIDGYVRPQLPDSSFIEQYKEWYRELIAQMKSQRIQKTGHLHDLKDIIVELSYLHKTLFTAATPYIEEFKEISNLKDKNAIEIVFHAMYMKLLLRLQKKEISAETEEAFDAMRILIAYLAKAYHDMKSGSMNFLNN